ncbi:MAG: hypothetical protein K2I06_14210 [Ruminococcus sp.]|nr:hypothetical protein [Ruminococcus sp.]
MIKREIVHLGFSQGRLDSGTGEESEDTWAVRTDFAEIPRGLHTISTTVLVGRKIWKHNEQTYECTEKTTDTLRYVYFYDENKNFIGYIYHTKNNNSTIDFFNHLGAKYVRFTVNLTSDRLYPDDTPDPKESYYYLQNFSTNCLCIEWKLNENNKLIHEDLKIAPEKAVKKPYPKALWRIDKNLSPNMPYHELLPGIKGLDLWSLEREHIIRVYDYREPQDGFKHNGLAILTPSECTSTHELNGQWDVTLTHPVDNWGRWKYLLPQNVLKIDGQLFRIDEHESVSDSSGIYIKVHAKHIWYDLADRLIYNKTPENLNAHGFINFLMNARVDAENRDGYDEYQYQYNSDISKTIDKIEISNASVAGSLIGTDNCFVNLFGGELYRNNFYFSINSRMENARDNAFALRYGFDMTKISQKINYSEWVTNLVAEDNYGSWWNTSWPYDMYPIHHHKSKYIKFNYSEFNFERFGQDVEDYFGQVCRPKITYTINIASIRNDPKYKDFVNLQNYNVGDRGKIYCELLDINTVQQIVSIKKNELTGDIIDITLGNTVNSIVRPSYKSGTISSGGNSSAMDAMQNQLDELNFREYITRPIVTVDGKYLQTSNKKFLLYKE